MLVYYFIFFLTLFLSYFLQAKTEKQLRCKLFWTFIPLFLFGALRVNFGNDYDRYEDFFNEFHTSTFIFDENHHVEYGYQLLCYLLPSFRSVLVLNSFLLCVALAMFCYRNVPKEYLWLAVLLIFLNVEKNIYGSLVGTRNGFAVSVFLLSTVFIQKRNLWAFAGMTFVAMQLHSSAIFYMPIAYFIGLNKELTRKEIAVWIIAIFSIVLFSASGMMDLLAPYILDYKESYELYMSEEYHRGFLLTVTGLILIALFFILFWHDKSKYDTNQNTIIRMGLLYLMTTLMGSVAYRAGYFYDMFFVGSVTIFMVQRQKTDLAKTLCIIAIVMSMYSFGLWRSSNLGNVRYDEYHSIFESQY